MRRLSLYALSTIGGALLLSCAPAPQVTQQAPAEQAAAAPTKEAPQRGGILMVPGAQAPENLHPYTQGSKAFVSRAVGPVYETLVSFEYDRPIGTRWENDFVVVPWLAESWQQPDDKTYVFHVRQSVKWHDGTDFTADDVAFSFDYLRDPKNAFAFRSFLADVAAVEKTGPYTVKVTTKEAVPGFLQLLSQAAEVNIVPKHVVERGGDLNKVAIGTGPFKLKDFDRTRASAFVRHESYWRNDLPYMDGLQVVHSLDDPARLAGFIANKFDVMTLPDKLQIDAFLAQKRDAQHAKAINEKGNSIFLKQDVPPFSDIRVRRALHLALDRQDLNRIGAQGEGTVNAPGVPALKEGWGIPQEELLKLPGYRRPKDQDIVEAKRLLGEAGYPSGFKTSLVWGTNSTFSNAIAEPIAAQYAKLGVDVALKPMTGPEQARAVRGADYEMALNLTADMRMAARQWDAFHSTGVDNKMGFKDPQLDRLLETQRNTGNVQEQKRAVRAMQDLLLDKLYAIPTIDIAIYQLWQPWVKNYNYNFSPLLIDQQNVGWMWLDVGKMPADRR